MADLGLREPELSYLLNLRREQELAYSVDDKLIDALRLCRTLQSKIRLDDKYRITDVEFHDPTIFDEIMRVAGSLSLNPPKFKVNTRPSGGDRAEQQASDQEEWTMRVFDEAGRKEPGHDAFRDAVDAACEGGAWSRFVFQNDMWDARWKVNADQEASLYDKLTEDAKKEAGQPFLWTSVDARTIYPVWSGSKITAVLIVTRRPRNQTLREFRLGMDRDGNFVPEDLGVEMNVMDSRGYPPYVWCLEYWDDQWYTFAIQDSAVSSSGEMGPPTSIGRILRSMEHGYPRHPFFYAPGYTINWQHGRKIGWGVAESKRWLVEYREYLMTVYAQISARDLGKVIYKKRTKPANQVAGDDRQPEDKEFFEPFQIVTLEDGEDMGVLDFGGGGESLVQMIEFVTKHIDAVLAPKAATDIGGSDPGSGFAISQIIAETQVREDPITKNIERMLFDMTKFARQLVRDKIRETVWVQSDNSPDGWLGMGPDDLPSGVGFAWNLDPQRAAAKLMEHRDLHERMDKGTIGRHQAIDQMGDVNPDDVDDDRELDRIRSTQWYIARKDKMLMRKLDRGDALYDAAEQIVKSGMLPGAGTQSGSALMGAQVIPTGQPAPNNGMQQIMPPNVIPGQAAGGPPLAGAAGAGVAAPPGNGPNPMGQGSMGTAINQVPQ